MRSAAASLILLLASCTAAAAPEPPVMGEDAAYRCREGQADRFVGQVASAEVGAEMLAATGARRLRWVAHGMMVTMDFSSSRLTVQLDPKNRIVRATCG